MSRTQRQRSSDSYKLLCGTCPDEECRAKLYFPAYDKSVECTSCGQRHEQSLLQNIAEVTNPGEALHNLLKNILLGNVKPKKGPDSVKVLGLSNYVCKLISPILTLYGMDRKENKAKLLKDMGQGETLDCGRILGDRAFLIEEENLDVIGYGRDKTGSLRYLADTLADIRSFNDNQDCLIPIHADGDGHCLVHAISRALVGRELFWHALRINLKQHLISNLEKYKLLFKDFIDTDEWDDIIEECDPYYLPPNGEPLGLRNIHIFGLANVLHRPIVLLDSKAGIQSPGDYSGVFLPGLVDPSLCKGKDGTLNKPLCIAWSSSGRNHYIPLVGVKGRPSPHLPNYMVQKSWGMPKDSIRQYIEFDPMYRCTIGGDKCLTDKYIRQLVSVMEDVFVTQNEVHPSLVADVHQYIYKASGIVGMSPEDVILRTQQVIKEKILYRCLTCEALMEYHLPPEWFRNGGNLYNLAVKIHGNLQPDKLYSFPTQGAVCSYDKEKDILVPEESRSSPASCAFCQGDMVRQVRSDGTVQYRNGDRTSTPSTSGKCPCGFKHYWDGKEYDNLPELFPISLQWNGKVVAEKVVWFQYESDPTLNSNVFEVAQALVQKHFPGEFGSERLVQRVVDTILQNTAKKLKDEPMAEGPPDEGWTADAPSKIILTGQVHKTLHKEELHKSEKEKIVKHKIEANAPKQQQRKTTELSAVKKIKETPKPAQSQTSQSSSSSEVPSTSSTKRVRLATSDGRQVMLTLVSEVMYTDLQKLIYEAVQVPADRQRIRIGFPPRILVPPEEGEAPSKLPLQHGDKISLEILPDPHQKTAQESIVEQCAPAQHTPRTSWSSFEEDAQSHTAETLLQTLKETQSSGDKIDTSIASLAIMSALSGKDLWTYVQAMPHLFSVGGLFYSQVERDLGLTDGKHCQLPALPGKVFRYNAQEDRLEICLEPYGHYQVEPDVENKVKESGLLMPKSDGDVKFGSSGAVGHHGQGHVAFTGHGHSLKSMANERMPVDIPESVHTPHSRGFHDLCNPTRHQDSIQEENEEAEMQVDEGQEEGARSSGIDSAGFTPEERKLQVVYQRLGPGYSVIDQSQSNDVNQNVEMFRALADTIKRTLSNRMDEDDLSLPEPALPPIEEADTPVSSSGDLCSINVNQSGNADTDQQMETEPVEAESVKMCFGDDESTSPDNSKNITPENSAEEIAAMTESFVRDMTSENSAIATCDNDTVMRSVEPPGGKPGEVTLVGSSNSSIGVTSPVGTAVVNQESTELCVEEIVSESVKSDSNVDFASNERQSLPDTSQEVKVADSESRLENLGGAVVANTDSELRNEVSKDCTKTGIGQAEETSDQSESRLHHEEPSSILISAGDQVESYQDTDVSRTMIHGSEEGSNQTENRDQSSMETAKVEEERQPDSTTNDT